MTDSDGRVPAELLAHVTTTIEQPNLDPSPLTALRLLESCQYEKLLLVPRGHASISAWGSMLSVQFHARGFYIRTFDVTDGEMVEVLSEDGRSDTTSVLSARYPLSSSDLHTIILDPILHRTELTHYTRSPSEDAKGICSYVDLDKENISAGPLPTFNPQQEASPPDSLYITVPRDSAGNAFRLSPQSPYQQVTLRSLTLHLSSKNGGLIRVPTKDGKPLQGRLRTAPTEGYQPTLVLTAEDLAHMHDIVRIPFFIKTDHCYGQGNISFVLGTGPEITLCLDIFLQPDGTTNVE